MANQGGWLGRDRRPRASPVSPPLPEQEYDISLNGDAARSDRTSSLVEAAGSTDRHSSKSPSWLTLPLSRPEGRRALASTPALQHTRLAT